MFSVSSLRDGEGRRAEAVALSYPTRDSGTGEMTTFTSLPSSEDPGSTVLRKAWVQPAGWISTPDFPAVPVPPPSESGMLRWLGDAEGMCFFSSGADAVCVVRSLWRNGRARWTSNPEVPGSSPGRDGHLAGASFIFMPSC